MSEVTAVPIAPTKRSWLVWLAIGVAFAVILGVGLAWSGTQKVVAAACKASDFKGAGSIQSLPSGVLVQTTRAGTGAKPGPEDYVLVGYKGSLKDGTVFDSQPQAPFPVSGVVPGFSQALQVMQKGGTYSICIPSAVGYGDKSSGPIPANSMLFFDIEMLDWKTGAEVRAAQAMQQQMQAMQQGQRAPGQ